jgi:hypothetical protein
MLVAVSLLQQLQRLVLDGCVDPFLGQGVLALRFLVMVRPFILLY